jgi:hypothetical protein
MILRLLLVELPQIAVPLQHHFRRITACIHTVEQRMIKAAHYLMEFFSLYSRFDTSRDNLRKLNGFHYASFKVVNKIPTKAMIATIPTAKEAANTAYTIPANAVNNKTVSVKICFFIIAFLKG